MSENKSNLIEELKKQADQYLAGWQRAKADYENLEKQTARERAELIKGANLDLIMTILPVLDNLEMAEAHKPDVPSAEAVAQRMSGVDNTFGQLKQALEQVGLQRIEVLGKQFDPNYMEAIEQREESGRKSGEVIEEALAGYKLNDKIIRPARVIVNK